MSICFWEPGKKIDQIIAEAIGQALEYHGGNRTQAAKDLGIALRTLRNWLRDKEELSQFRPHGPSVEDVFKDDEKVPLSEQLREHEIGMIREALLLAAGNHARAALHLGMNRTTLVEKMKRHGLLNQESASEVA